MKKIIVCDSGLGGLNIAARCFQVVSPEATECSLLYFNAYPDPAVGFNKLATPREQEKLFRTVLKSMEKFSPDLCIIACNTLSIVYERLAKYWTPSFPVAGIINAAVDGMRSALIDDPESQLLILGTKTTVESGVYAQKLVDSGIACSRINALACPGLATLLESDPAAPEVAVRIRSYASEASRLLDVKPRVLHLALCCTHFEFAESLWLKEFGKVFPGTVKIVNPNAMLTGNIKAVDCEYLSRIEFFPGARAAMSKYFAPIAPLLSRAVYRAQADENLFEFNRLDYL